MQDQLEGKRNKEEGHLRDRQTEITKFNGHTHNEKYVQCI